MKQNSVYKNKIKINDLRKEIKWMCYDVFITIDKLIVYHDFSVCKSKLINTTIYYFIHNNWRNKQWINNNCIQVLGYVDL